MNIRPTGYFSGKTPSFTCQAFPRFSYCLYVPKTSLPRSLLVAVHDTLRNNQALRDLLAEAAEAMGMLILAPLFPASIGPDDELDDYKYLRAGQTHYDAALLAMVDEVAARYRLDGERFALFGFSGGAHFVHRFLYLWPHRLSGLVVVAPGSVTLPDPQQRWWAGLADFEARFGRPVDWEAVRRVPVHLAVGDRDTDPAGTVRAPGHPHWVEGANSAGANRVERLRSLHAQLCAAGVAASYEEIPDTGHDLAAAADAAVRFLRGIALRHT